ncbi:MAG: hypothetical protein P4L64_09495 [Caulobacteraceae bacterium]|nr:hypothetical protein [Caulobacteraceae bacterium]
MSMGRLLFAVFASAGLGLGAHAAEPTGPSRQQLYNDAQAAFDRGDWTTAATGLKKVLDGDPTPGPTYSKAVVSSRLAQALTNLSRYAEAEADANSAIAMLSNSKSDVTADLVEAYLALGDAQRYDLDEDGGAKAYRHALTLASTQTDSNQSLDVKLGLIQATMTTDPETAATVADTILSDKALLNTSPR